MHASADIDRRFLSFLTDLLLCSRCLRNGVRTRVKQAISRRHRPLTMCRDCRADRAAPPHRSIQRTATPTVLNEDTGV